MFILQGESMDQAVEAVMAGGVEDVGVMGRGHGKGHGRGHGRGRGRGLIYFRLMKLPSYRDY